MTWEEYYKLLKEKYSKTDWNNKESVKQYNDFAKQLRKELEKELEEAAE